MSLVPARGSVRLEVDPGAPAPRWFVTRLTRFSTMVLTVRDTDGRTVRAMLGSADFVADSGSWTMRVPLPESGGPVASVEADITGARHAAMFEAARLDHAGPRTAASDLELTMAMLCGLLFAPLLFNVAFWRVLKQRFLVWHTLAVLMMLVQTLITSGLINRFGAFSVTWLSLASALSFGGGIGAASLFAADLIEPDKLRAAHRRWLIAAPVWIATWTMVYLFAQGALLPYVAKTYYASFLPVLALFAWTMTSAARAGSRVVWFQIAAWLPFMAVGIVRIASMLGATAVPLELDFEQQLAVVAETLITALGVVDRFMVLRRQRDHALFETRLLEEEVERDPLTGLLNRRAIEERFGALYAQGFRTMAVIDLDHFKDVNDRFGHDTGDQVLRAVASALAPDGETRAIRLGGEEFMLLLRGSDAGTRAEQRRNAIALRIASTVHGLDRVVTASMGLVVQDGVTLEPDFARLYAHCDRLLYEAKRNGRNRAVSERMQGFDQGRRAAAA